MGSGGGMGRSMGSGGSTFGVSARRLRWGAYA